MDGKELQKHFRAASWETPEQLEMFLLAADVVPAAEVLKLLPLLTDKSLVADARAHKMRCMAFGRLADGALDPSLFVPFVRTLKIALDSQVRTLLAGLLPRVNSVPGHPELVGLMRLPDAGLRKVVGGVLRQLGGKTIFETLVSMLREESPGRTDVIDLVAGIGGHHAIPALGGLVASAKPPDKIQALRYLGDGRVMAREAAAALAAIDPALKDPVEQVRLVAIAAYASLCDEETFYQRMGPLFDDASPQVVKAVVEACKRFPGPRTIHALERKWRMGPNVVRFAVLNALEHIGDDTVLPVLTEALNAKQQQLRNRAGEVLSNLGLARKINLARTLMWLLRSRDVNVRRLAVDLARKVGDPGGDLWPSLLRFLRDEDWWVRERVMDALVEMAGNQLTRHIVSYLQDGSDVVRRYAVDVLLRLKDPASLGALVRSATGDPDWWVRERSLEAVGAIKDARAVPYVVDLMNRDESLRLACLAALQAIGAPPAAPAVANVLQQTADQDVKLAALGCLAVLGEPSLAPAVQPCLADPDHRVRGQARTLLERWQIEARGETVQVGSLSPLDRLLQAAAKAEGDDFILAAGRRAFIKRLGVCVPLTQEVLDNERINEIIMPVLSDAQKRDLERMKDIDFSYEVKTEGLRFRANVFNQNTGLGAVFRIIKDKLMTFEQLGLPPVVQTFGELKNGLVLVGGPTGSGKSTTLAAIIDYINRNDTRHIITLEDPIEVMHTRKKSLVTQRELGTHTRSFNAALRSMLRQDPDVILVGEMRDLATISFAVSAAETGHLVFGTLHTVSADTTVDRLINTFPSGQQAQVRSMLAESLRAVVCQHLLRRPDKPGARVAALEIMVNNDAISNLVRKGKAFQIPSVIATSKDQGMQLMDNELKRLLKDGKISADEAYMKANDKKEFEEYLGISKKEGNAAAVAAAGGQGAGAAPAPAAAGPVAAGAAARPAASATQPPVARPTMPPSSAPAPARPAATMPARPPGSGTRS